MKSYLFVIIGAEYILRLLPKGTHDYAKFIRPAKLAQWARLTGLDIKNFTGMSYNPLILSTLVTPTLDFYKQFKNDDKPVPPLVIISPPALEFDPVIEIQPLNGLPK